MIFTKNKKILNYKELKKGGRSSIDVTEQRPIVGVAANVNNNKIETLQYFVDDNPKHSKRRYTLKIIQWEKDLK